MFATMNTNTGNDPMLSSFMCDDWTKLSLGAAYPSPHALPSLSLASGAFTIPMEGLLSPEPSSDYNDLACMWSSDRKQVSIKLEPDDSINDFVSLWSGDRKQTASIKLEIDNIKEEMDDDDMLCATSSSDPGEMGLDDIDVGSNATIDSHSEVDDADSMADDISTIHSEESFDAVSPPCATNALQISEKEARKLVEEQFERIAFLPNAKLTQREKIRFILAQSDCKDFSVEGVLNFDKRKSESARACAKIVQNIPQRYRWECVRPEDIPCCYTIVADCKKISKGDKAPRPMNAFMIWAQGARRLINVLCPKMQNALISEALGYYWRQKSDAFKQRFEEEKIKLRRFHNVEFPEYKYKPKTKVQKAKEKQELSLSKAKLRASLKRERTQLRKAQQLSAEGDNLYKRRVGAKCGRPRKTKASPVPETKCADYVSPSATSASRLPGHEEAVQMSPTKPAIKDMLTLKILNDRRAKETAQPSLLSISRRDEASVAPSSTLDVFGQMSPLELNEPAMGDILEDLTNLECLVNDGYNTLSQSSSVYDTPANTPPSDEDEQPHLVPQLSPTQHCQNHDPASPPTVSFTLAPSPTAFPAKPVATTSSAPTSCFSRTQILMPSLSAMLASPAKPNPFTGSTQKNVPNVSVGRTQFTLAPVKMTGFSNILNVQWIGKANPRATIKQENQTGNRLNFPKVAAFCTTVNSNTNATSLPLINKIVSTKTVNSKRPVLSEHKDSNNNNCSTINHNTSNSNNNNNNNNGVTARGAPPTYASSIMNVKLIGSVSDSTDLDSLSLDLNVPLLSEDIMRSYIDTL